MRLLMARGGSAEGSIPWSEPRALREETGSIAIIASAFTNLANY